MSPLTIQPQLLSAATEDLAGIRTNLAAANSAAAAWTTGLPAAAGDEISAAAAQLFDVFGVEYQNVVDQISVYEAEFGRLLTGSGLAYVETEIANAIATATGGGNPLQSLLHSLGAPAAAATIAPLSPVPADLAIVMGGSGLPIPGEQYINNVLRYVVPTPLAHRGLFTPEGLYPLTGIKSLPLNISVSQGLTILNNAIFDALGVNPAAKITVLGYSQSSIIASLEMRNLLNNPNAPSPDQLSFTLLANQMNPNGGLFARFPGLSLPSLGIDFLGATPSNTQYHTNIFSIEGDGYSQFPRYPLNFLADLNAFAGIQFVHGTHPQLDPANLPPGYNLVELPVSENYYANGGVTHYYVITTPHPPLMQLIRSIPLIGTPVADLIEPSATYLINLGYGDGNYPYSTSPADIPTPFGIWPSVSPVTVTTDLLARAQQGGAAFMGDIGHLLPSAESLAQTGSSLALAAPNLAAPSSISDIIHSLQRANTNITNAVTNVAADSYAMLLPTADIVNGVLTSIPSYDVNLFLDGIGQATGGDPIGLFNAFASPVAANVGLFTLAGGIQLLVVVDGVESIVGDISKIAA